MKPARALAGELRSALKSKLPNQDVEVKELYYKTAEGERIYWLIQQKEEWKVISDAEIPDGTSF